MICKKTICLLSLVVIILCTFGGCASSGNNTSQNSKYNNPFSRETVEFLSSKEGFGSGRTDVETVVLKYVYNDAALAEKYGDTFCVDNFGGSDDGITFLFSWLYKGTGDYFVEINGDTWWVNVSKSYFGKWEVTDCYQKNEQ